MKKHLIKLTILLLLASSIAKVNGQWVAQYSGTSNDLASVYFTDENTGYVVGISGTILKTTNGGETWVAQTSGTYSILYSICFPNENTGYVVGTSGTIRKTINGGETWVAQTSGMSNILLYVCFTDENTGYVVGSSGTILKTTNAGETWVAQTSGTSKVLESICFPNENTGYVVGSSGTIRKTTNAGETWVAQTSGASNGLTSVYFIDENTGYIAGDYGTILKTTNGGETWIAQISETTNHLRSVFFIDESTGYVVGHGGTILKTTNGGTNWSIQSSGTSNNLSSIYFTDENTGYVVGDGTDGAKIRKTTNGGWCTGVLGQPDGEINICNPTVNYTYTTSGATYATSYEWSLNPSSAGTITGTGTISTVTWSGTYNGSVEIKVQGVKAGCIGEYSILNVGVNNTLSNPNSFSLSSPTNGSWVSETPMFQWASSSGTLSYQIFIDGVLFKDNITTTSYQVLPVDALPSGMHTWYVVASNGCTTQSNETRSFMVDATPPTAFNLLTPVDNSWTTSLQPILEWSASSDSHSGLTKYQLWIDGVLNRDNISPLSTSTTPIAELSNGTHTWEIRAVDNVGNVTISNQMFSFKTDNIPPQMGSDYAYRFYTNNSSYAYTASTTDLNIKSNKEITIEAIINKSNLFENHVWYGSNYGTIVSKSNNYVACVNRVSDATYKVGFKIGGDFATTWYSNSILDINEWYHVAFTYDGSFVRIYINGQLDLTSTEVSFTPNTRNTGLYVGSHLNYNPLERICYFDGIIDEVRIWNYVRTESDISTNMNKIIETTCSDHLLAYWTFNDYNSTFIFDETSNSFDLNRGNIGYNNNTNRGISKLTDLIYPICFQYIQSVPINFVWTNVIDAGIGTKNYKLFIDNVLVQDNINESTFDLFTSLSYGKHTWFVNACDSLGNNQYSYTRVFYIDNAPPNPFNLISPANNEGVMFPTPNLSWEAATDSTGGSGMRKYQLWINGVINRDSIPIGTTTASPASALPQGEYTWFVRAYDNVGNFRQSTETRTFYVDWEAPTDFVLIAPSDGATVTISQPTFEWEQSFDYGSGLSKYELCISGQSPIEISPIETEHSLTFELPNGTYSWYVKAYDYANAFTSSNTHTLYVAVPLPEQAATPVGLTEICSVSGSTNYETSGAINASTYNWEINPSEAGILTPNGLSCSVIWNQYFTGEVEITVTGENSVGNGPVSEALLLNLYAPTDTATANGGSFICLGLSTGDLYLTGYNGSVLNWQKSSDLIEWTDIESTGTIYNETLTATGQYFYRAITQNGACPSVASNYTQVNVADVPGDIGIISGLDEVCQGQNEVSYTVPGIDTINNYIWTLPSTFTGTSTTNEINISFTDLASSGNILVAGENSCGVGQTSELFITVLPLPHSAGSIEGTTSVCQAETGVIYTVPEISNATSYVWTLPSGATGTSTSNSITVDFGSAAISGDISVYGTNNCGDGQISTLAITVNPLPEEAGLISGTENVCFEATGVTYTVPEISNATSYVWSLPSGVTGTSTNNSITVDFESSAISGDISVYGTNDCGDGQISTLAITVNPLPDAAETITGNIAVCQGATGIMYTVPEIANATSYVWTLPSGITGTSTSNSITVDFESIAISSDISVYGTNDCGNGQNSTLAITVNPLPDVPENITGSTAVCQGSTLQTYTVPEIANVTSYVWTLPNGATGTSASNSIDVDFGTTAISGDISVHGTNDCGDGQNSTLSITVNPLPDEAGTIIGNTTVCQGETGIMYTVPEIANATSYVWSLPSGVTGTSTNNSITVDFESSAISGDISVYGSNDCGNGQSSTLGVIVNEIPQTPTISLSGNTLNSDATVGNQWYLNDEIIIGAINQDYNATSDGNYFVIVTLLGCSSTPSNIINVIGTDIYIINNESSVNIYPNPVKDELIIEITNNTSSFDYEIINSMGQVVKEGLISTKAIIQTSNFTPGVYLIKLENGEKFEFRKIVKE